MPSQKFQITITVRDFELFGKISDIIIVRCPNDQCQHFYYPDKQDFINHVCCENCYDNYNITDLLADTLNSHFHPKP